MNVHFASSRPFAVTLTLWGVFLFGIWNIGKVIALSQQLDVLLELGITPDPRLRLLIALIWVILFFGAAVALRQKRPFTRQIIPVLLLIYAMYELGLLAFFTHSPLTRRGLAPSIIFYVCTILFSYWALNRTVARSYFARSHVDEEISGDNFPH